jgi:NTP pyrophosphatase (non-canonical NTP hydrolase)
MAEEKADDSSDIAAFSGNAPEGLRQLTERLREFRDSRDWAQFHSPNRLAIALNVEASEVLEHFLWIADTEADTAASAKRDEIAEELADVLIYLIYLADRIGVDLLEVAGLKINRNEKRFPRPDGRKTKGQVNG